MNQVKKMTNKHLSNEWVEIQGAHTSEVLRQAYKYACEQVYGGKKGLWLRLKNYFFVRETNGQLILTVPLNYDVKQYQQLFEVDGIARCLGYDVSTRTEKHGITKGSHLEPALPSTQMFEVYQYGK